MLSIQERAIHTASKDMSNQRGSIEVERSTHLPPIARSVAANASMEDEAMSETLNRKITNMALEESPSRNLRKHIDRHISKKKT